MVPRTKEVFLLVIPSYLYKLIVPGVGVEPTRSYDHDILSVACIPFHHPGNLRPGRDLHPRIALLQSAALAAWLPGPNY